MPQQFAEKYLLATEQASKENPACGLNGFDHEWNLLDEDLSASQQIQTSTTLLVLANVFLYTEPQPHSPYNFNELRD